MDCIITNYNGVRQRRDGEKLPDELIYLKNFEACTDMPRFRKTILSYMKNFNEDIDRIYLANWRDPIDWESKQSYVVLDFIFLDEAETIKRHFLGKVDPRIKVDLSEVEDFNVVTQALDVVLKPEYDAYFSRNGMVGFEILEHNKMNNSIVELRKQ
ncbi:MAG: hypothetical protein IKQ31_04590 [Clostridia bacterium]|nr:hypothetical protein [Clostridia bacterium]